MNNNSCGGLISTNETNLVNGSCNITLSNGYYCATCGLWVGAYQWHSCHNQYPWIQPYTETKFYFQPFDETVDQMLARHKKELNEKLEKVRKMKKEVDSLEKLEKAIKLLS